MTDIIEKAYDKALIKIKTKMARKKPKKPEKSKKITYNWKAIKKMAYSPIPKSKKLPKSDKTRKLTEKEKKQQKALRKTWKKALALHNKGLSDAKVRKEMGWD